MECEGKLGRRLFGGSGPFPMFRKVVSRAYVYQRGRLLAIVVEKLEPQYWLLVYSMEEWVQVLQMKFGILLGGVHDTGVVSHYANTR
jgi:hypothetical protein